MPGCSISKKSYRCFPWAENRMEQQLSLFFHTPQVKFQPLKVCCTDSIIVGKAVVTLGFHAWWKSFVLIAKVYYLQI